MRYVLYGAGAVGGVIGGRLHLAGLGTTLIARGEHLAQIKAGGLLLDTDEGVLVVNAPATETAGEVEWTADTVVLLTVKSHQTLAALEDLAVHAPADTTVISVQNGVANEVAILRRFAATYSICVMLPSTHLEPGIVVQKCHPTPGILDVGRFPGGVDDVSAAVAADLRTAGFESVPRPDIMAWKHRKLLMNLGNGVDAAFARGSAADELAGRARAEGERVLELAGIPVVSAQADTLRRGDILQARDSGGFRSGGSTWQSLTRGSGGVETDYLSGEIVLLGRLHGIPTPVNELVQLSTAGLARTRGEARSLDAVTALSGLG